MNQLVRILKFLICVTNLFSCYISTLISFCLWLTAAPETVSSFMQGKMSSKTQGIMKNQLSESSQPSAVPIHNASSVSRSPSNYSSRSQEIGGSQKGISTERLLINLGGIA